MGSTFAASLPAILTAQNQDGGWAYRRGGSWTEPTAFALLALLAEGQTSEASARALRWLRNLQRSDGGWPPNPSVAQSTWVTALAVLLLADDNDTGAEGRAVGWILAQTGRESGLLHRIRMRLLGFGGEGSSEATGWPWYPETAAWVSPTALTVLALEKVNRRLNRADVEDRRRTGRAFLLEKMCEDGGWNHGSSKALGYEAKSYPETTGLALLALHGAQSPKLGKGIAAAQRHLRTCRSAEGISWLQMGLHAHSQPADLPDDRPIICRNVLDSSLGVIARAAMAGKNVLLG
jgi:squalene cyclase